MTSDDTTTAEDMERPAADHDIQQRRALVQVLLVEDTDDDAARIEDALRVDDIQEVALDRVTTLQDALVQADARMHDVVLLDLDLPDSDGLETLHRFRGAVPRLPVVVLTGHARPDLGVQAIRAGAEEYLVKEYALDGNLGRTIRHAMYRGRAVGETRIAHVRWKTFVESAPGVILATDTHGTIVYVNRSANGVLSPLVGKKVLACIEADHRSRYREVVEEVAGTGESRCLEVPVHVPEAGVRAWFRLRMGLLVEREHEAGYLILAEDITQERQERQQKEAFRAALDESRDAVYVIDMDTDRFVEVNAAASRMLGFTREALLEQGPAEIDVGLEDPEAEQALIAAVENAGEHVFESEHRRADGTTIPVEVSVRGLVHGGRALMVAVARDITERRNAEEAFKERRREEEEMQVSRNRLLGTIAHDLAQPLSPLLLESDLLERFIHKDPHRARRAAQVIRRNAQHADRLVRDLKELARVEGGAFRLSKARVDIDRLVHEAVESNEAYAHRQDIVLVTSLRSDATIEADRQRLDQVLYNMIVNAIKFSARGSTVHVTTAVDDDHVVCRVQDEGRGLTEDEVERVFEPFVQVHAAHETPVRGMGLGLYIARTIVEAHGGSVWAHSEGLGAGATFGFRLPMDPDRETPPETRD